MLLLIAMRGKWGDYWGGAGVSFFEGVHVAFSGVNGVFFNASRDLIEGKTPC